MIKDFFKGITIGLGILFVLSIVGLVYAVGFHTASEILPGTFNGNFIFNGDVNISPGSDLCIQGGNCLTDNVNWSEISGMPAGFADGSDDGAGSLDCTTVSNPLSTYASGIKGSVDCPSGYTLTGGGCKFNSNQGHRRVSYNSPTGNGWVCVASDYGTNNVYVYARCCRII